MARRDLIASLFLVGLALAYLWATADLPQRTLPNTPGPRFFPWLIGTSLLALALALLGRGVAGLRAARATEGGDGVEAPRAPPRWRALVLIGAFAVYLWALPAVGFVAATVPFFALAMWLYRCERLITLASVSIAAPLVVYYLFREVFHILLPSGPW